MRNKRFVASILLLLGALVAGASRPAGAVSEDPLEQFKLASIAYQNGRFDTAEQEYEGFLKYFHSHRLAPQAQFALGEIKFALKKYPEAAEDYSTLIKKWPNAYEALNAQLRFGQCEFNMKKYLNAMDRFSIVKAKAPKALRSEGILGVALCWMALNNHDKAEGLLNDLLQSYPKYKGNPTAVVPLGLLLMERNRLQEALDIFALTPDDLGARYYRGVTLRKLGQVIAASQAFKDVYQEDPKGYWADKALLQMAEAYYQVNDLNLAYNSYRSVYDKFPTSALRPYALHRMACIYFSLGRYQEAGLKWQELIRTFPDDVNFSNAIFMLGEMAMRQGEYGKAIGYFSQIADAHELRMDAQYKILWCQAEQKMDEAAIGRADQFLKEYPWGELAAKAHLLKGICLQRMQKFKDANDEYQIVLDQFGNSIFSEKGMYLMATSLYQSNHLAEIITNLNAVLKMAPVSPSDWQAQTYLWVAEAYYALNQYDASERTFQLVVDNYKTSKMLSQAMLGVAASMAKEGEYDKAAEAHQRALEMAETTKSEDVKRSVLMDTAEVLFSQKQYEKAMGYFDEFIARYPDDKAVPQALYHSGECFYRLEYYNEAIKRWQRIVNRYSTHDLAPEGIYEIAKTYFGLGNYPQAANEFQLLIEKYGNSEKAKDARIQVAQCFYNEGQFDLAIKGLQDFLDKYPKDPKDKDVLELLQMAHYRQGKGPNDLVAFTKAFPKSKLTADIYWQVGADAYNKKDYKMALDFFRKLVGEFPEAQQISQAFYYMGVSYFNLQDYPNAVTTFKNLLTNFPKHPNRVESLFKLGVSYFQTQDFGNAVIAFNDVLEADPNGPLARDAMSNIPLCYKRMNQNSQALAAHRRFLERFPNDPQRDKVLLQIGSLSEETSDYDAALKYYQMIPDGSEASFQSLVSQARVYHMTKMPNQELASYEKLRAKKPRSNEVRLTGLISLAELYQSMGQIDDSIAVYDDIAVNSQNPDWKRAAIERARALKAEARETKDQKDQ